MEHRPCLLAILWVGCLCFVLLLAAVCVFLRVFWYLCASPLVCDGVSCTPGARQDDHKVYCSGESGQFDYLLDSTCAGSVLGKLPY